MKDILGRVPMVQLDCDKQIHYLLITHPWGQRARVRQETRTRNMDVSIKIGYSIKMSISRGKTVSAVNKTDLTCFRRYVYTYVHMTRMYSLVQSRLTSPLFQPFQNIDSKKKKYMCVSRNIYLSEYSFAFFVWFRWLRRLVHGEKLRWLTSREKLAASGLAISELQAKEAGIRAPVQWSLDMGWHDRVGNGNQLQNVGLVLLAALANLRIRDKAPENLLFIEPPSEPDGLSVVDGVYILKVGHLDIPVGGDKVFAYKIHKQLHEP